MASGVGAGAAEMAESLVAMAVQPKGAYSETAGATSRYLASAAKRKLQRVQGALHVLESIGPTWDHTSQLLRAEQAVGVAHRALSELLESTDGGESLKRVRSEWHEARGVVAFVHGRRELRQYVPSVEREEMEARAEWEKQQGARQQLSSAKQTLAEVQGRFYALLELGFTLPTQTGDVVSQQREMWLAEEAKTRAQVDAQAPSLDERKRQSERFHHAQGQRKGGERFGELLGMGASTLVGVRLDVLEADAVQLRLASKGQVSVLSRSKQAYEASLAQLHATSGAVSFLESLKSTACTAEVLAAEEYEASVEAEALRGTLASLAPRVSAALHLKLGWYAKVGELKDWPQPRPQSRP